MCGGEAQAKEAGETKRTTTEANFFFFFLFSRNFFFGVTHTGDFR